MALTLTILADGPSAELVTHLGPNATALYTRLLLDTIEVARQAAATARIIVRYDPGVPAEALAALDPTIEQVRARAPGSPAEALEEALEPRGPAIVIADTLPHLPPWRLRDALFHLEAGADLVIGPADKVGWYLLGLREADPALLQAIAEGVATNPSRAEALSDGHVIHILPPWFGVDTVADLASLAEELHAMPRTVAPRTRALIEIGPTSRAVGG